MKFLKKINVWIASTIRKRHITVQDGEDERWSTEISPIMAVAIGVAVVTLTFGLLLVIVAYTPLLDTLPGYRTNAGRSREMLIRSIVRIDSLERKMNDMLAYNENRILVVSGKTPAMRTTHTDSLDINKSIVAPSRADSLLRQQMENDERYRLSSNATTSTAKNTLNTTPPMYGLISERFNSQGLLGIKVSGAKDAQVSAIADGMVIISDWSPESGHILVVQHKENFISVYRHLSGTLVNKGSQVRGAQAIGYAGDEQESDLSTLEFELWRDGKAVNPELYIIF